MGYRKVQVVLDSFYHLYNRGANKQVIFKDNADHFRFQELLYLSNTTDSINVRDIRKEYGSVFEFDRTEHLVAIGAYCLMPNHFHLLVTPLIDGGVETFMRKISTGYSMYFNKRYERTGTLFEGRYKSEYVDSDEYLKYLFSYIHLNPLKIIDSQWKEKASQTFSKNSSFLNQYQYSSFVDYAGGMEREETAILDTQKFPEYFPDKESFLKEIQEWMTYTNAP